MLECNEKAIIVRRLFPRADKFIALTRFRGKVRISVGAKSKIHFSPGMLVELHQRGHSKNYYDFCNVRLVSMPVGISDKTIEWLHALLEIVHFFVPAGAGCEALYDFLEWSIFEVPDKDLLMCRLAMMVELMRLLGFYPPENLLCFVRVAFACRLRSVDSEKYAAVHFGSVFDNEADALSIAAKQWVTTCLREHPRYTSFKVAGFFA
ncbi:hypothetical protein HOD08_00430 [bacterium]|mgnify:CR=1 FL=1|nr:hypothetical protein [bacterium]